MIVNVIFSPIICLFINKDGYLPSWLSWFQTQDNPAIGDKMFHDREMSWTQSNYLRGIFWAIRNPAYGFMSENGLTVWNVHSYISNGPDVDIGDFGYILGSVYRTCTNNDKEYFNYKSAGKWNDNFGWMVEFGWSLKDIHREVNGSNRRLCVDIRPRISLKLGGETTV